MGKQETTQIEKMINVLVVLSLVFLCMYVLPGIFSFTFFPDEFGYWASAARALSYDWSEVASIGSYYSFGYSLILTPILFLFSDSVMAYRAAVVVNLILQIVAFFILKDLFAGIFKKAEKLTITILAGIAVLYPSWVFYTQTTMAEGLLFFMYVFIVWLMARFIERPGIINGVLLGVSSVYIYTVHMRSVGILVSVVLMAIINIFLCQREKKKIAISSILIVAIAIAGIVIGTAIKNEIILDLYSSGVQVKTSVNDYSGQTGKITELFSLAGIGRFIMSLSGKILYLGCASFGTAYIGVYSLIKRSLKGEKSSLFIVMASAMEFMVMCIYLLHSADTTAVRYDLFLHGRYYDFVIPILMATGIYELLCEERTVKKMLIAGLVFLVSAVGALIVCARNTVGMSDPHAALMIGMSYFLDDENVRPFYTIVCNVAFTVIISSVIVFLVLLCKKKKESYVLTVLPILLIVLGYIVSDRFIYNIQIETYGDIQVAEAIRDLRIDGNKNEIVVLYINGLEYADTLQLALRDEKIHVEYVDEDILADTALMESYSEQLSEDKLYLINFDCPLSEVISGKFRRCWESGHFDLYYN